MDLTLVVEQDIADIRVRRSWNGKLVLQVRRHLKKHGWPRTDNQGQVFEDYEPAGVSVWRDANANDVYEVGEITALLMQKGKV